MKPGGDLNGEEFPFASANPRIIRIVTGYDTREAALNAANVAQAVRRTLPAEYELLCRFWRFDVLQIPSAANMAIAEANAADVIICSTLDSFPPSETVKKWVTGWLSAARDEGKAVVFLSGQAESPRSLVERAEPRLVQAAERGEVELFYMAGNGCLERYLPARDWLRRRATQMTPTLLTLLNGPPDPSLESHARPDSGFPHVPPHRERYQAE